MAKKVDELEKLIKKNALFNALKHKGKAAAKFVMKKVVSKGKTEIDPRKILQLVQKIVDEVNEMTIDQQREELEKIDPELFSKLVEKRKEEKKLPELPNVEKYSRVVMRLAPFPSGPLHIGNARMVILNDEYVKRYKGSLLLVFDDTIGSQEKVLLPEAYDLIKEGLQWLGVKWHKEVYKSDRLPLFYQVTKELIEKNAAYICLCPKKVFREKYKLKRRNCPHRDASVEKNMELWNEMLEGKFREGEAVARLKTSMQQKDPALRDPVLMRVSEKEHPRVGSKYIVWPLLEFSWAVDDHYLGITHILRGKDLIKEDKIESFVWKIMNWEEAEFIHYGMIKFRGLKLSKTEARKMIEKGVYMGWYDPRTWSLQSLMMRGIKPEAIREAILSLGLSLTDVEYSPENLYAINRRLIDPHSQRFFAVSKPATLLVKNIPQEKVEAQPLINPSKPELGKRKIKVKVKDGKVKLLIEKRDLEGTKPNETIRLKDLMNVSIKEKGIGHATATFHSFSIDAAPKNIKKISWVPATQNIKFKLISVEGETIECYGEKNIEKAEKGQTVQFERLCFAKLVEKESEIKFFFTHL